jgi:hypothetical protein
MCEEPQKLFSLSCSVKGDNSSLQSLKIDTVDG